MYVFPLAGNPTITIIVGELQSCGTEAEVKANTVVSNTQPCPHAAGVTRQLLGPGRDAALPGSPLQPGDHVSCLCH